MPNCSGSGCSDTSSGEEDERQRKNSSGRKSNAILARPNTSAGFWVCCLLPLTFATRYLREPECANSTFPSTYNMLAISAAGMCVESLCFFMYMFLDTGLLLKLIISFAPGLLTTFLYTFLMQQSWSYGIFWGFGVTFCYQNAYIRVMRGLPHCFTYGEAAVLVQGLMLFVLNVVLQLLPKLVLVEPLEGEGGFAELNAIMMCALFWLLVVCWLLATFTRLRQTYAFYPLMVLLVIAVTCTPITNPLPVVMLFDFLLKEQTRLNIIAFYLSLVGLTIATVWWQLRNSQKASTSVRKIFHLLIILVYVPGLLYQCTFLYIASGVALAIFTVLELFRILEIPPLADSLKSAFASFSDEKDAGILALTPFCLLVGCSLPIWLSPCPCRKSGGELLPLLAGILAIGVGDAAASVVGSKFGRTKWRDSLRSVEGSVAFIVAVLLAVYCLDATGYIPLTHSKWFSTVVATCITALVEARTDQIDNLVLPLIFYIIVSFG